VAYTDFTYPKVLDDLGLTLREEPAFAAVPPADPGAAFLSLLSIGVTVGRGGASEKARSEFVIAPLLLRLLELTGRGFGLHSGVTFDVDKGRRLNGVCDFLVTRSRLQSVIEAPVLAVAECKPDVPPDGYGQCIAAMVAAREFNARKQVGGPVFGGSTSGTLWQFLRLDGDALTLDPTEYLIADPGRLLGILLHCVSHP
jgi:hypothetical protein